MAHGKILYQCYDDNGMLLTLERSDKGEYYLSLDRSDLPEGAQIVLPSAKCDELRVALMQGFDPDRMDPNEIAAAQEPPHPDD